MTARGLVVASLESWDAVWRRNQHLVAELLRHDEGLQVLFVEPPRDVTLTVTRGGLPRRGAGLRTEQVAGVAGRRLWLYQPTKPLPRRVAPGYDRACARRVLRIARRLGLTDLAVWVNDPSAAPLAELAPGRALYDVTDDWLLADRGERENLRLRDAEARLLRRCESVTVCSPTLVRTKGRDRDVVLVTNAVDVARYRTPAPRPADLPPGPVALYVGTLHRDRLDVDATAATARTLAARPDGATLVLLGPDALAAADSALLRAAGAVLLGARPADQVPAYLQHAHAAVVPHVVTPFTDSLDPLKLYEYLAVGRPVVTTPVAGFRDLPAPHRVVAAERFPEAVAATLDAWAPALAAPGELPTWTGQADLMRRALGWAPAGTPTRTATANQPRAQAPGRARQVPGTR